MKKSIFTIGLCLFTIYCFSQVQKVPIVSEGVGLNAYLYQADGSGLKPTIIWCHGNPGSEVKGESEFGKEMAKRGFNFFRFNYRGLWGTDGEYTPGTCQKDLKNILDFFYNEKNSSIYNVDTTRIIVAGYSHGSNVTIVSAMYDERIKAFICLGLADFSYLSRESFNPDNAGMRKFNHEVKDGIWGDANWGQGKYARDYDKYIFDIMFNNYKYDFVAQAERLKDKRMFFVIGMNDVVVPIENHFFPLYRRLKEMKHENFKFEITDSNHSFKNLFENGDFAEMITKWINEK